MKPLPKWVTWLSTISGLFGAGGGLSQMIPPKYAVIITGVATVVNAVSHSVQGTGGTPNNP